MDSRDRISMQSPADFITLLERRRRSDLTGETGASTRPMAARARKRRASASIRGSVGARQQRNRLLFFEPQLPPGRSSRPRWAFSTFCFDPLPARAPLDDPLGDI